MGSNVQQDSSDYLPHQKNMHTVCTFPLQWSYMSIVGSKIIGNSSVCCTDISGLRQNWYQNYALLALCEGNPPVTNNTERVFTLWRLHYFVLCNSHYSHYCPYFIMKWITHTLYLFINLHIKCFYIHSYVTCIEQVIKLIDYWLQPRQHKTQQTMSAFYGIYCIRNTIIMSLPYCQNIICHGKR